MGAHALGYSFFSHYNAERFFELGLPFINPLLAIDQWIPLVPISVWVYYSYIPSLILFMLLLPTRAGFREFAALYGLGTAFAFVSFLLLPVAIVLPPLTCNSISCDMINQLRQLDAPVNLMPSLHAFHGTLMGLFSVRFFYGYRKHGFWLWSSAIVISALLTKQHAAMDIFAGVSLAVALFLFSLRVIRRHAMVPNVS